MPVKENTRSEPAAEAVDYSAIPGSHVIRADGVFLGTYNSAEDAQAFIDGHVVPNGEAASIVEGSAE
jgi:hypothetical protein